jgi:RNA polymerase sporulation-specific sigma factor
VILLPKKKGINNEELFAKAQAGDKEAEEELIVKNQRLCYHIAHKFSNTKIPIDDLASMGTIGLMKAYKTFDLSKNIKFATYATSCINNEILMFLRKQKRYRGDISLQSILNYDGEGNELTVEDTIPLPEPEFNFDDYDALKYAIQVFNNNASEPDKQILQLRFFEGKTQLEASKVLGISQSYVSRKTHAVKEMLEYIVNTGKFKKVNANKTQGKFKRGIHLEALEMSRYNKGNMIYIFENYPKLKTKAMAELLGFKPQSITNYKSQWKNGAWSKIKSIEIDRETKDKIEAHLESKSKPKFIVSNSIPENSAEKVKIPYSAIPIDIKKEENININNKINIMSNKEEVSTLLYGIYYMIQSLPVGAKVKLDMEVKVDESR